MKELVVIATEKERRLATLLFPKHEILLTGVGALNTIRQLRHIPKETHIINVGFVGSTLPKRTNVIVTHAASYHRHALIIEPTYDLAPYYPPQHFEKPVLTKCLTSTDFVLDPVSDDTGYVYDMELAFICAMGFEKVSSCKIVSDCLNLREYREETGDSAET